MRRLVLALLVAAINLSGVSAFCQAQRGPLSNWWQNGCKVGPHYARPAAPVASEWIDYANPKIDSQAQPLTAWWTVFNDPTLNNLIQTAYQQNLTLRTAGARILEARAQLGIARGEMFPQEQFAFADYTRSKLSERTANPPPAVWISNWRAGMSASWELDFWGRFRRAIEAADAELDASVEDYDDVLVVLLSDVATNYVQYRTFEQRLAYARKNVEIQRKSYGIATDKWEHGATTERDAQQAKQVVEETEALIPALEIGKRQAANRLCVLLGMPPTNMEACLGAGTGVPVTPLEVIAGVPADLVRRRPDLRRAERQVAAQSARIGIAASDLYPHFTILGTIGVEAENFNDLFKTPGSTIGSISPGVRWDILNYGRLINGVRVQDARFQELAYAYQDRVLNAGREVEDGMVVFLRSQEQAYHLDLSAKAAARTVQITEEQYNQGAVDFTAVYLFQTTLTEQQDELAVARGDIALGLIAVYRALGGGWEIRLGNCGQCKQIFSAPELNELPVPQVNANAAQPACAPLPAMNATVAPSAVSAQALPAAITGRLR